MAEPVRLPSRDIFNLNNELVDVSEIEQLLFEEIGGTELINLTSHDTVDGIDVFYSIISDLSKNSVEYDPSFILTGVSVYEKYNAQYPINIFEKIPTTSYIDKNSYGLPTSSISSNVYVSSDNKVNIEFDNLIEEKPLIQIFFLKDATINTVRENDY